MPFCSPVLRAIASNGCVEVRSDAFPPSPSPALPDAAAEFENTSVGAPRDSSTSIVVAGIGSGSGAAVETPAERNESVSTPVSSAVRSWLNEAVEAASVFSDINAALAILVERLALAMAVTTLSTGFWESVCRLDAGDRPDSYRRLANHALDYLGVPDAFATFACSQANITAPKVLAFGKALLFLWNVRKGKLKLVKSKTGVLAWAAGDGGITETTPDSFFYTSRVCPNVRNFTIGGLLKCLSANLLMTVCDLNNTSVLLAFQQLAMSQSDISIVHKQPKGRLDGPVSQAVLLRELDAVLKTSGVDIDNESADDVDDADISWSARSSQKKRQPSKSRVPSKHADVVVPQRVAEQPLLNSSFFVSPRPSPPVLDKVDAVGDLGGMPACESPCGELPLQPGPSCSVVPSSQDKPPSAPAPTPDVPCHVCATCSLIVFAA